MSAPIATAVSFKLPPFYVDHPLLWYIQCEAVFRGRPSSDEQRLAAIVEALPHHIAIAAGELIAGKDPEAGQTAYYQLKAHHTSTVGKTKLQLATALLATRQRILLIGDRKQSATPTASSTEDPGLTTAIPARSHNHS